ncbi:embryonic protein UVS.2-like [Ciona intestinalis]
MAHLDKASYIHSCIYFLDCRRNITASDVIQRISSPNYPLEYTPNLRCEWNIQTEAGYQIQFTIGDSRTESCCDKLRMYEGTQEVGEFSNTFGSENYLTANTSLRVTFTSDGSVQYKGFTANIIRVPYTALPTIGKYTLYIAAVPKLGKYYCNS